MARGADRVQLRSDQLKAQLGLFLAMNRIANSYRDRVLTVLQKALKAQVIVTAITLPLLAIGGQYLSSLPIFGVSAAALMSVPLVTAWAKKTISRYEKDGWKSDHPELDFSGHWTLRSTYWEVLPNGTIGQQQVAEGYLEIEQSVFHIAAKAGSVVDATTKIRICNWKSVAAQLADDGKVRMMYETTWHNAHNGATGGIETLEVEPTARRLASKPVKLVGSFVDIAERGRHQYAGSIEYSRR